MHDLYEGFAERYDLFYGEFSDHDPELIDFYRKLFRTNKVRSVLDCACGTGRDIHLLYTLGCEVVGSDVSESMLAQAGKNLSKVGVDVPLQRVDYRELPLHFDRKFNAVVCLSSSILHMNNESEVQIAFKSMYDVLDRDGILVLTQGTTDKQWKKKPRFILAVNNQEFSRLFVIDYLLQGARYHVLDVFHGTKEHGLKVWSIDYPCILLQNDHERLLKASGFGKVDCFGTYRCDPYDSEISDRLIMVARK